MCTLTWLRDEAGLRVFFNRDEKRTRAPGLPPQVMTARGVRYLAPVDSQAGGTWIAANAHGLVVALLNYYDAAPLAFPADPAAVPPRTSRGHLVREMAGVPDAATVGRELREDSLESYPPFILFALDGQGGKLEAHWDGRMLVMPAIVEDRLPVTTSSFRTGEVLAARRQLLREQITASGWSAETARAYHRRGDHLLVRAFAICMTRPDAMTVSHTEILVTPDRVEMTYAPRHPQEDPPTFQPGVRAILQTIKKNHPLSSAPGTGMNERSKPGQPAARKPGSGPQVSLEHQ